MADDEIRGIEAVFGAISRIAAGEEVGHELSDARCPRCGRSDFAHVPDVHSDAVARLEESPADADVPRISEWTDRRIATRLAPPQRKSVLPRVLLVALPLGALAAFAYMRVGEVVGQIAIGVAIVSTVIFLLTSLRRLSDDYYDQRRRWNGLYMCRHCGQLVSS